MKSSSENRDAELKEWAVRVASIAAGASTRPGSEIVERSIGSLLRIVREHLKLDVVFVGEFVDGHRVFRQISSSARELFQVGQSHPLEESVCQRIVDGRLPHLLHDLAGARMMYGMPEYFKNIGAHIGVPVRFADGTLYGVLCGFSREACPHLGERDVRRLEMAAAATARLLAQADGYEVSPAQYALHLDSRLTQ
jgi:hypothetical protein